ncbi:lamin tail domain-containing protein [bacterium]|nr:lamin tail domain-containing protein [bacterium]
MNRILSVSPAVRSRVPFICLMVAVAAWTSVATARIVINEIVYKDNGSYDSGDWVELFNDESAARDVSGWILEDGGGNTFTNPPGTVIPGYGYLVVYLDNKFLSAYPAVTNRVGPGNFGLSSNDAVIVSDNTGDKKDEVEFDCGAYGWPFAYGNGSLELRYPYEENSKPYYWVKSMSLAGSPGARNPNSVYMHVESHDRNPDGPTSADTVAIEITATDPLATVTAAVMHVSYGSGYATHIPMVSQPGGKYFTTLPPTNEGQQVMYYISLFNNMGQVFDRWWYATNDPYMYIVNNDPVRSGFVINEIMYNSAKLWQGGRYEYIEVYNITNIPVDISYWIFQDEIDKFRLPGPDSLTLSSGWYLVLADTTQALTSLYGPKPANALFVQIGDLALDNGGEIIKWQNANGENINSLEYDDKAPWPTTPDGNGPSLELIDPSYDNTLASSWLASLSLGTPGRPNSVPEPVALLVPLLFILNRRVW